MMNDEPMTEIEKIETSRTSCNVYISVSNCGNEFN